MASGNENCEGPSNFTCRPSKEEMVVFYYDNELFFHQKWQAGPELHTAVA